MVKFWDSRMFLVFFVAIPFINLLSNCGSERNQLSFDRTSIDVGVTHPNNIISAEYRLTNSSSNDVFISKIIPSCGCTVVRSATGLIASGESRILSVTSTIDKKPGKFSHAINIYLKDQKKKEPSFVLTFSGVSQPLLQIKKNDVEVIDSIRFDNRADLFSFKNSYSLVRIDCKNFDIVKTYTKENFFHVEWNKDGNGINKISLFLNETRENKTNSTVFDELIVETTNIDQPIFRTPVYCLHNVSIVAYPSELNFGVVPPNQIITKPIFCTSVDSKGIENDITEVTSFVFETKIQKISKDIYRIDVIVDTSKHKGVMTGNIKIKNSKNKELSLPYFAYSPS